MSYKKDFRGFNFEPVGEVLVKAIIAVAIVTPLSDFGIFDGPMTGAWPVRLQRVGAGHGTFDTVDGDASGSQVNVGALEHADFGRSEAVSVGDGKDGAVAFGFDNRE